MSGHSLFAPSSAHRWLNCPGSMAFLQNTEEDTKSSTFADDGTASHSFAADALNYECDAIFYLQKQLSIHDTEYVMNEERAEFVQMYLDDVRRRAMGGFLMVEQRLALPDFGPDGRGTADAVIIQPSTKTLIIEDLKYGIGEKIFAAHNEQGMSYALGALADARLICEIEKIQIVICQPRLGHIDEWECTPDDLEVFREKVIRFVAMGQIAQLEGPCSINLLKILAPGSKTCRWCHAKAICPALKNFVVQETRADFDDIVMVGTLYPPVQNDELAKCLIAIPLIEQWCDAVKSDAFMRVAAGETIEGSDGHPLKLVEGKQGNRAWRDERLAEAALSGQLTPDKMYQPQKLITASAAAKLLDKKATRQLWTDIFDPLIVRSPGKPMIALGSDTRLAFIGAAQADEFNEVGL